jgi:hypothetical protein
MTTAVTKVFQDILILLATRLGAEGLESVTFYHFNDVLRNERVPECCYLCVRYRRISQFFSGLAPRWIVLLAPGREEIIH